MITWLQDKKKPLFTSVIKTLNSIYSEGVNNQVDKLSRLSIDLIVAKNKSQIKTMHK